VSFDRAADYYDVTRGLLPETMAEVVDVLVDALSDHQPVLEIGVGTGRIAVPLAEAGLDVVGIDLSDPMLRKLQEKDRSLPVARADCARLPFSDARFGGVVASHVFHLVPEWRAAVQEVLRVLRPDGAFLYARGGLGEQAEPLAVAFAKGAGLDRTPVGLDAVEGLDAYVASRSRGRVADWLPEVEDARQVSIDDVIGILEAGVMGWTWPATDEERRAGGEAARRWAAEHHERTDVPLPLGRPIRFRRYVASGS
jgi:SAM-dependent methyltransferase